MKKILSVFFICIVAIFTVYFLRNSNLDLKIDLDIFKNIAAGFNKEKFEYTNDFKVNKLQMKQADYYFKKLTASQKQIYSSLAKAINKLDSKVEVLNYNSEETLDTTKDVSVAMDAFFADHPEVFYLKFEYTIISKKNIIKDALVIEVQYTEIDKSKISNKINELDNMITSFSSEFKNYDIFEKELKLHDKLAKEAKYYEYVNASDIPQVAHTSYGALINKSAVCDGLTKAMQLLLDRVGMESILVSGVSNSEPHAWNMVNLDNEWYHMDITSNKFIKNDQGKTSNVVHSYFNITEEQILSSHKINNQDIIPKANSNKYNYYVNTNSHISSVNDFTAKLKEIVKNQESSGILEFSTDKFTNVPDKMSKVLYDINFNNIVKNKKIKLDYYNILNTYILIKN